MAHHPRIDSLVKLGKEAEATWLQIGALRPSLFTPQQSERARGAASPALSFSADPTVHTAGQTAESVSEYDRAIAAYESALRHNAYSVVALSQIAAIYRSREEFKKAAEYFGRVVSIAPESGDVWGALGHCFLMIDDLKKAYSSYQQALYYMPNPHEPKLWYGIGILYDRYGSLEHAEEAFSSVIRMEPNFEKANEIFFRLGIIYKQQRKSAQSLECFRYILNNPPRPLTEIDIWFQIGHVYEQQKDFIAAKESYERVLQENPAHAKVLQQLGGLYHRSQAPFYDPEASVQILTKSLESDPNDPFSWYLLGRAYMTTNNFGKAYEAYQQAVYRDGKNPAFWCSIGVLYYNINQYHDALDAYSRAIRIHPYLAEVWYNLGALYEACNDQMTDAIDAYQRTLQLDPSNSVVAQRLNEIRDHQTSGVPLSPPPPP
ncbi:TPR-like protein, partial [Rhodotorula sp. JG-1b]